MEAQSYDDFISKQRVKGKFKLGSELFSVSADNGTLSEQLATMKEQSMAILKDFITRNNVPNDVPDEPLEGTSEDESGTFDNPPKPKKQK